MLNDWGLALSGAHRKPCSAAMQHVVPSHLADPTLFNFAGLALGGALPDEGGDTAV